MGLLARENANRLYKIDKKDETYFYIFLPSPLQAVATGLYNSARTLSRTEHTLEEAVSLYSQPQNQLTINSFMFLTGGLQKISDLWDATMCVCVWRGGRGRRFERQVKRATISSS